MIQGRATYAVALEAGITSPYAHLRQYVVSRSLAQSPDPAVTLIGSDPVAVVRRLKQEGAAIYLAGGGDLAGQLLEEIDELVLKTYPVLAGAGTPLFSTHAGPTHLALTSSRASRAGSPSARSGA